MGKAFGILMIVLGIYVGLELYTVGMQNAFGGIFVKMGIEPAPTPDAPTQTPMEAIRERVTDDVQFGEARRDLLMEKGDQP